MHPRSLEKQFKQLYKQRRWQEAKEVYETARKLSLKLSEKEKIELFGNRPYRVKDEKAVDGLFPEWMIQKVYEKCIFS